MQPEILRRATFAVLAITTALPLAACFLGDENKWATREQVVDAAARCGVPGFEPTKAPGDAWAAYVDPHVPQHLAKEKCIYSDLEKQGLGATE